MSEAQPERHLQHPQGIGNNYTQVNILFPSEQVELPAAEKLSAFSPEAQNAILVAFSREQIERHAWLKKQQANDHQYNMQSEKHFFYWKISGVVGGIILALGALLTGAWLVTHGCSAVGTTMMIIAVAGLVGTAIYGHKSKQISNQQETAEARQIPNQSTGSKK